VSRRAALAYWLAPRDAAALVHAVDARLATGTAAPALADARRELDAAMVRLRWFDPPSAVSHRRVAHLDPGTVPVRLTAEEKVALTACDPALVTALLDSTGHREPDPAAPPSDHAEPASPITLTDRRAGAVLVLDDDSATGVAWALGELDGGVLRTSRPHPDDPAWEQACDEARRQYVDVDTEGAARRLVARGVPALSSLALARPELRPGPGEAVLLRLPFIVVIAPEPLAARIAEFTYPVDVRLVAPDALPATPGHRADVTL
jgi:hypothetical protein